MKPNQRPLVVILSLLLITTSTLTFAAPSSNSEQKEPLGIVLYNQLKIDRAILELEREAADGNSESQYYLGEALRKKNRFMTPEAQHWYESAAEKNNVYAIIQLARAKNDLCTKIGNCPPSKKTQAECLN